MKIEDFRLKQANDEIENINPFVSFSCEEYEKQIMEEMMLNGQTTDNIYKKFNN